MPLLVNFVLAALQHGKPADLAHDQTAAFTPRIVPASDEARTAIARFQAPDGFRVELVAAEPLFANPVAFWPAHDGSFYVAETFRHHQGVTDLRDHMDWLDDDLAARTVADRVAYFRKQLGERFSEMELAYDRVSLLRDTDGDGVVDRSTAFSTAFAGAAAGIAAGVLEHHGDVFVTSIPSFWRLRDTNHDDVADETTELATGFGVHVALLGHDMHGLVIGPDERLYFSIGDRGFDVKTNDAELHHPQCGAVLRCELDGSRLEVFATGLRNPQELAFDDFGNLFTGDNNSDGGDKARLVHVVEGGDSGWRQSYQWITEPALRGPWNEEKLWHPHHAGQAAYIVPPIENFADGPSGLTIDPGTGCPERWRGRLFLCDFRGDAATSGVHAIELEPKNATFALKGSEHAIWRVLATDCDFGPDGSLYVTDWTQGWSQPGTGRLYRVYEPSARDAAAARETRELLRTGVGSKTEAELGVLCSFADRRVRLAAQFELAARKEQGRSVLEELARRGPDARARVHGIAGLAIQARKHAMATAEVLLPLLVDKEPEVRAQAAHALGDLRDKRAFPPLLGRLTDASPRVRMFAAIALGRIGNPSALQALLQLVRETKDEDPVLRHAAIFGLAGTQRSEALVKLADDPDAHVRLAAVVALRRHASLLVARFLADADALVQTEAARAIDDLDLAPARADLASLLALPKLATYDLARRAINACVREGARPHLLAAHALRADADERTRREALQRLVEWRNPPSRDAVSCAWRPFDDAALVQRRAIDLEPVVARMIEGGIVDAPERVLAAWLKVVEAHAVASAAPAIEPLVGPGWPSSVRCSALRALAAVGAPRLREAVQIALADTDGELRATGLEALTKIAPEDALPLAVRVLVDGELGERRVACRILGASSAVGAGAALAKELEKLANGLFPVELAFDLCAAAHARREPLLDELLARTAAPRAADPMLAPFVDGLFGGDRERGKQVFREKNATACLRCHKTEWDEGGTVGPDLRGLGKRLARLQMLESIVLPNRHVAAGYRNTVFAMKDERIVEGRVLLEDDNVFRIIDADARTLELPKIDVEEQRPGRSAMPEGFEKFLSPAEMRDLIEYLAAI
ncbi:MAG: HEAT repeat domain-containing protein [Planctomycetes bacterium]|nr:HEAT repeat domain-containing protein [Planctomycetota bacterium]